MLETIVYSLILAIHICEVICVYLATSTRLEQCITFKYKESHDVWSLVKVMSSQS